jgi:hypothetical protein
MAEEHTSSMPGCVEHKKEGSVGTVNRGRSKGQGTVGREVDDGEDDDGEGDGDEDEEDEQMGGR